MKKSLIIGLFIGISALVLANSLSDISVYDSGSYPRGITMADINGDGKAEVIVANFGEDTLIGQENDKEATSSISVFSSAGGTELKMERLAAGISPRGLASGDVDGDKDKDFVVSNYDSGTVMIFEQNEGAVSAVNTIEVGKHPVGVALGGLDNSGNVKEDIAVAVYSDNKVVLLVRDSQGGYEKLDLAVPGSPTDVVIGKTGGEKILVSANYTANSISIIKKNGGKIEKVQDVAVGGGPCKVEIADVTGDGVEDIVVANFYDNTVSVIEYKNGKASEPVAYKLAGSRPNGMAAGDVNGDGLTDVVTANRDSDTIDILLQKDGKLELVKTVVVTEERDANKNPLMYGPVEIVVGDVNSDGMNDIAFTHMRSNTLRVIYQGLPESPVITSDTHPSQDAWYPNDSPVFKLSAADLNGVAGYLYTVAKEAAEFDPKKAEFTTAGEVAIKGLESGIWFFAAATKDTAGNISAKPAVYKVQITEEMSEKNVYNYPNPCKDRTVIRFPLAAQAEVKIVISDIKGAVVWQKTLSSAETVAGVNYITWMLTNDVGKQVSNGVYICKVISGDKVITKKIAVVK